MNDPDSGDTICAISTPPGQGGIGMVRLSGPGAIAAAQVIFQGSPPIDLRIVPSHTIHHGHILDPGSHEILDEVLVSVMRSPKTYTREDIVEINAHGNSLVLQRILVAILRQGLRLAEPGEFTKRAFLNGRIGLTEAEAVMELIEAKTEAGCRAAVNRLQGALGQTIHALRDQLCHLLATVEATIDFPEEELGNLPRGETSQQTKGVLQPIRKLLSTSETGHKPAKVDGFLKTGAGFRKTVELLRPGIEDYFRRGPHRIFKSYRHGTFVNLCHNRGRGLLRNHRSNKVFVL